MPNLDEMKIQAEAADKALAEAADARNKAIDDYDTARVEAMDAEVVEEAKSLNINPRNFEGTAHLQAAIDLTKEQNNADATEGETN